MSSSGRPCGWDFLISKAGSTVAKVCWTVINIGLARDRTGLLFFRECVYQPYAYKEPLSEARVVIMGSKCKWLRQSGGKWRIHP